MNWVSIAYKGNLEEFIQKCQQSLVDIALVNIKIPPDVLLYMILGNLCNHTSIHLESKHEVTNDEQISTALIYSSSDHLSRLVYYCANGVYSPLNTSHKPNQCYFKFPHLQPKKKNEKDNQSNSTPSTHLSTAYALMTFSPKSSCKIIINSAATHHMFNNKSLFTSLKL
ncbi:hypothetical protein O181_042670 [Austropuccinia psidii MF-1]|uniref:Uncharacterized protein n=1 Tax=Austropuccinia psidii MF-1 TaxID=1389203 RepID=A0A9Q3DL30_9BASI|nr:hypothetical protein [Austropuccinia psidii MF-1]